MEANSSSFSTYTPFQQCLDSTVALFIIIAFMATKFFLVLPLSVFVLYLGHKRWRRQRSFATSTHSDIFACHLAAMEVISALGMMIFVSGTFTGLVVVMNMGTHLSAVIFPGQIFFHILTCVEHYLAVVQPIVYLRLKHSGGFRIRNICTVCVWLLCIGWIGVAVLYSPSIPYIPLFFFLALSLVIVSCCSLSVLCVLIRPGPGETVGHRARVDQSKQRAFNTITAIMAVLWLFFIGVIVCLAVQNYSVVSYRVRCLVLLSGNFATLPCSLVSPLLFLHRAGKLLCCH